MNSIPLINIENVEAIKRAFVKHVCADKLESYRLPVADHRSTIAIGLSGGADSAVLALYAAIYLNPHYPNIHYIFTDTKAEPESCAETLDAIERFTGIHIHKIVPEKGLFELIDHYNGFLPGAQARWCTRELKINPLIQFMETIKNEFGFISLAGIRFDEANREGIQFQYSMENASAAFPLIELTMTKAMVFDILANTIGVPKTYQFRGRSGCFSCFFIRSQEAIGMLLNDPASYAKTEAAEKLDSSDTMRWENFPTTLSEAGIRGYYPVPAFIDIRKPGAIQSKAPVKSKEKKDVVTTDLFSSDLEPIEQSEDLFAAFALYVDPAIGVFGGREFSSGCYWQEFITVSTSLNGIKTSLGTYYQYKKTTPLPLYSVDDLQIVIVQIRFPKGVIDTAPPSKSSYTWKSNIAYKQLRNLAMHCISTLQYVDLTRRLKDALGAVKRAPNDDAAMDAMAHLDELHEAFHHAPKPTGKLLWEGLYVPTETIQKQVQLQLAGVSIETEIKPARENLEYDEVPTACLACSI